MKASDIEKAKYHLALRWRYKDQIANFSNAVPVKVQCNGTYIELGQDNPHTAAIRELLVAAFQAELDKHNSELTVLGVEL
jgi:hypothetical protein